jgi:hypothetical protein
MLFLEVKKIGCGGHSSGYATSSVEFGWLKRKEVCVLSLLYLLYLHQSSPGEWPTGKGSNTLRGKGKREKECVVSVGWGGNFQKFVAAKIWQKSS